MRIAILVNESKSIFTKVVFNRDILLKSFENGISM